MAGRRSLAVMVIMETDDKRLFPENLDVSTAAATARLRRAVINNLGNVTRVVMVLSEDDARMMASAHDAVMREIGQGDRVLRPPPDYVPPTRD